MNDRRTFLKTGLAATAALGTGRIGAEPPKPKAFPVDRRVLGRTGASVSLLGLGLGSAFTRPNQNDPEMTERLLQQALDLGINYWDTARGYGPSERMIGPMVEKHRDSIYLVTKSGGRTYDDLMRDLDRSLLELKTDHLDLYHIWNLPADADLDQIEKGAFRAVKTLLDEKVIGHFGITGHRGADILMRAMKRFDPDVVLTVFPCTRDDHGRYEDELLPLAREKKIGVVGMKTVRRARNADLKGSDLIRYALSLEGVHSTIVGLDTLAHLRENAEMATNFAPMQVEDRVQLHRLAEELLADIPTPWEQPGYQDGFIG